VSSLKKILTIALVALVGFFSLLNIVEAADYVPNEVIVKFSENKAKTYKIIDGQDVLKVVKNLSQNYDIDYIEPNYIFNISTIDTNDQYWTNLWGFDNTGQLVDGVAGLADADMDLPEAWTLEKDASEITVAIIDTGADLDHEDLVNVWQYNASEIAGNSLDDDGNGYVDDYLGFDFVDSDVDPNDDNGHGTHVAGIAGAQANNSKGVLGTSYNAQLLPLRALNSAGSGTSTDIAEAIDYAVDQGIDIINLSIQASSYSEVMFSAISRAQVAGILVIVAAGNTTGIGNDNDVTPTYPCSYDLENIICVGATDQNDFITSFSHYGETSVDVFAPGQNIYSTYLANSYTYSNGTSMASPAVAGIAALLKAYDNSLTYVEIKNYLIQGVDLKSGLLTKCVSGGRVNAYYALQAVSGTSTPEGTLIINDDENYANQPEVNLSIVASDLLEVNRMRFSNDGSTWSSWEALATQKNWRLNSLEGEQTVYLQLKNVAGITSLLYSDSIIYDSLAPQITILPTNEFFNNDDQVSFAITEEADIYYTLDGLDPVVGVANEYIEPFDLLGDSTLKYLAVDLVGNQSSISTKTYDFIYKNSIITAAGQGGGPHVRAFDENGLVEYQPNKLFAFSENFRGGLNVATGDIDGDGQDEIIAGVGPGEEPWVKVFEKNGTFVSQFLAYAQTLRGGVYVAAGDLDGDGRDEIITGVPEGYGPHVRVFNGETGQPVITAGFFAYDPWVRTGIRVAAGDLNGDGVDEIVTGTGFGAGTHVRTFTGTGEPIFTPGFFVYGYDDRSGINVGVGDVDGDGDEEIITGSGQGRSPEVRIYEYNGEYLTSFVPYLASYNLGVKVAVGDIDGDNQAEIVTGTVRGGGPQVRVFEISGTNIASWFAYDPYFRGGVEVAVGNFLGN